MNLGSSNSLTGNNLMSNTSGFGSSSNSRTSTGTKRNSTASNKNLNAVFTGTSRNNKTSYGGHDFELNNGILSVNKNGKKSQTVLTSGSSTFISPPKGSSLPKFTLFQSDDSFAKASNEGGNLVLYAVLSNGMDDSEDSTETTTTSQSDSQDDTLGTSRGSQFSGSMSKDSDKSSLYKYKLVNSIVDDLEGIKGNMNLTGMLSSSSHFQGILMKLALVDKLMESDERTKATSTFTTNTTTGTTSNTGTSNTTVTYYPGLRWVCYPSYHNDSDAFLNVLMDDSNVNAWKATSGVGLLNPGVYNGTTFNFKDLTTISVPNPSTATPAFGTNTQQQFFSLLAYGYFKPNVSGEWVFSITSDDGSSLWINCDSMPATKTGLTSMASGTTTTITEKTVTREGANVIKSFNNFSPTNVSSYGLVLGKNGNALIKNIGSHGPVVMNSPANFTANVYYPIVTLYGNNAGGGTFGMTIKDPNGLVYSTNCSGILFNTISK